MSGETEAIEPQHEGEAMMQSSTAGRAKNLSWRFRAGVSVRSILFLCDDQPLRGRIAEVFMREQAAANIGNMRFELIFSGTADEAQKAGWECPRLPEISYDYVVTIGSVQNPAYYSAEYREVWPLDETKADLPAKTREFIARIQNQACEST